VFTVAFVLHEKGGVARADALRYWGNEHGRLVAKVPGVRRYLQQHAVGAPEGDPPFLGLASLYFDDEDAFATGTASPEFAAAVADLGNFADPEKLPTAFVEDVWIVDS
jgi:uncharacterized protein (TIGR02118 family)